MMRRGEEGQRVKIPPAVLPIGALLAMDAFFLPDPAVLLPIPLVCSHPLPERLFTVSLSCVGSWLTTFDHALMIPWFARFVGFFGETIGLFLHLGYHCSGVTDG